jgi:hypothetical protein
MPGSNGPPKPPDSPEAEYMRSLMREAQAAAEEALQEELARNPGATLDELNAALQERALTMNHRAQQGMGGLSPDQVRRLVDDSWEARGAVRLNLALSPDDLASSRTWHNARVFLRYLEDHGPVRATATGNLSRATVQDLVEAMRWPEGFVEDLHEYNKVLNELDVFPLHVLRLVLDLAGLIKRRSGKFSLTRRGGEMLADERSGELFVLLFRTTFRKLNLGYLDRNEPIPDFQHTLAYVLYRLSRVADAWERPEELIGRVVLPYLRARLPPEPYYDPLALVLELRLLRPLEGFGLIEKRVAGNAERAYPRHAYRKTPLYDRFLRFHLPPTLPLPGRPHEAS